MNTNTQELHDLGQSLWLDNISREILANGTLARYIAELSVTGLTSNPTIFEQAIGSGSFYDDGIRALAAAGPIGRGPVLRPGAAGPAAGRRPVPTGPRRHRRRRRLGLARGVAAAGRRHGQDRRRPPRSCTRPARGRICSSRFPGTPAGIPAIEESIFAGVPINVTLLFSREQYLAAAEAYLRGIERRIAAGLDPKVAIGRLAVRQPLGRGGEGQGRAARCAIASASRSRCAPTRPTATCWPRRAGRSWRRPAPARSGCSGPAPAPRTRARPTRSTSRRWPRPTRSTRFPRRRCRRSPTTARSAQRCRSTAATPKRCSRNSGAPGVDDNALATQLQREGADVLREVVEGAARRASPKRARCWPGMIAR